MRVESQNPLIQRKNPLTLWPAWLLSLALFLHCAYWRSGSSLYTVLYVETQPLYKPLEGEVLRREMGKS